MYGVHLLSVRRVSEITLVIETPWQTSSELIAAVQCMQWTSVSEPVDELDVALLLLVC